MINTYHIEPRINSLGPGLRFGLWVQTCRFACKGCLVPDSWHKNKGQLVSIASLTKQITTDPELFGITISGGEPLLQIEKITELLQRIKSIKPSLTIILYTGYQVKDAVKSFGEKFITLSKQLDVIIDGLYLQNRPAQDGIRGSVNQRIYLLTDRIRQEDLIDWSDGLEYFVKPEYSFVSGVPI